MGVQYAIHLLKDLPKSNCSLTSTSLASNQIGLERDKKSAEPGTQMPRDLMDGPLEEHNKDSLRTTMLKQEKIFHEQVLELHRLYRIQRALMSELSNETALKSTTLFSSAVSDAKSGLWSSTSDSRTSLSSALKERATYAAQVNSGNCFGLENNFDVQRSWAPRPSSEDASPAASLAVQEQPHFICNKRNSVTEEIEENGLDLTLRIGTTSGSEKVKNVSNTDLDLEPAESTSNDLKRAKNDNGLQWKEHAHAGLFINFSSPGLQCPPWLLQALSFNRTHH